jgi:hypothetical protein
MIDTHSHIYQHVTGKFGLNADLVGVYSGVTTVVDQDGPSCVPGADHFTILDELEAPGGALPKRCGILSEARRPCHGKTKARTP